MGIGIFDLPFEILDVINNIVKDDYIKIKKFKTRF